MSATSKLREHSVGFANGKGRFHRGFGGGDGAAAISYSGEEFAFLVVTCGREGVSLFQNLWESPSEARGASYYQAYSRHGHSGGEDQEHRADQ